LFLFFHQRLLASLRFVGSKLADLGPMRLASSPPDRCVASSDPSPMAEYRTTLRGLLSSLLLRALLVRALGARGVAVAAADAREQQGADYSQREDRPHFCRAQGHSGKDRRLSGE
jgi:hypothetical protein